LTVEEFVWPVRVYYEDTDAIGVVYYANYLKYMERARTEWLRSLGFEQDLVREQDGVLFAVRRVEVDYLRSARFNEELECAVRLAGRRRASLLFDQEVRRASDGEVMARGQVKVACLDAERLRPAPIPERMVLEIRNDH
jgi:acyl-CoA thioester hydrolase